MASMDHEALVTLFRNRPRLAAELLHDALGLGLPAFTEARIESAKKFPNEAWSIEDERAAHERDLARTLAEERRVSVSTIYLVLDEGIRAHWPGSNHKPLDASVVPLKPRPR